MYQALIYALALGWGDGGEGMGGGGGKEWGGWEGGTMGRGGVSAREMLKCSCIHCHRYKMVW